MLSKPTAARRFTAEAGDPQELSQLVARRTAPVDCPLAEAIVSGVPVYDGAAVEAAMRTTDGGEPLLAEFDAVLETGAGALVVRRAIDDRGVLDRATELFADIIEAERAEGAGAGDHFAKPGANDRVWNALEKHALADPENFVRYFASPGIAAAATAWLGPGYQMTAQVNRVNPGGAAQTAHRDYHLGFMDVASMTAYPIAAHALTARLTLQGGVAHGPTPIEAGPTMLLPHSQLWTGGYIGASKPEALAIFAEHAVQIPLEAGDAVFFNPALLHAAGENRTTDTRRLVNLLQISSAFGRAMEMVDRTAVATAAYGALLELAEGGEMDMDAAQRAIAAAAEGYAFPTSLDRDPPIAGAAPATDATMLEQALKRRAPASEVEQALAERRARRVG